MTAASLALGYYNLITGVLATMGLAYLLYLEGFVIESRRSFLLTTAGLGAFSVLGPLLSLFLPHYTHLAHAVAAAFVVAGQYDSLHGKLPSENWASVVTKRPSALREGADWMTPMDDVLLELLSTADLVLSPTIVAYNTDYSREEVNRRLSALERNGFVERVERGKYRITFAGKRYLVASYPDAGRNDTDFESGSSPESDVND